MDTNIIVRGPDVTLHINSNGRLKDGVINIVPTPNGDKSYWDAPLLHFHRRSRGLGGELIVTFRVGDETGDFVRWISQDGETGYWDLWRRAHVDPNEPYVTKVAA